ncbi:hypothetical protein EFR01_15990 [Sinorhizobium fredii]|nr:hypothetical protein EFR01_15990 [Sinorhizobium fredii]GLS09131.1 hypothetical protein GCM10007864_27610 [Sinorhizobium fredii]
MQSVQLAVAVEMTDGVRIGLQPLEKVTQRELDARRQHLAMVAQKRTGCFVEAGKAQALEQTARLALPCLF